MDFAESLMEHFDRWAGACYGSSETKDALWSANAPTLPF